MQHSLRLNSWGRRLTKAMKITLNPRAATTIQPAHVCSPTLNSYKSCAYPYDFAGGLNPASPWVFTALYPLCAAFTIPKTEHLRNPMPAIRGRLLMADSCLPGAIERTAAISLEQSLLTMTCMATIVQPIYKAHGAAQAKSLARIAKSFKSIPAWRLKVFACLYSAGTSSSPEIGRIYLFAGP